MLKININPHLHSPRKWFAERMQVVPHFHTLRIIHRQQLHRRAARCRSTNDLRALPSEMFGPFVSTRMEQRNKLPAFRIKAGNVRPLVEAAEAAGQRQIVQFAGTTVLASDDVLDMEACES